MQLCRNTFPLIPGLLVNIEPQRMLEKAIPRKAREMVWVCFK